VFTTYFHLLLNIGAKRPGRMGIGVKQLMGQTGFGDTHKAFGKQEQLSFVV
jgi:hypothetical protein